MFCCAFKHFAYDIVEQPVDIPTQEVVVPDMYTIQYTRPKNTDMAVCLVFFNPSNSKRMLMNYFYMLEKLKLAQYPVFTLELTFQDRSFEIKDAIHLKTDSYLFHKERLCRLLETKIPSRFTKLCFLDADVLFENANWYNETSKLLDTYEIVQPFARASWLDLTYKTSIQERLSVVFMDRSVRFNSNYHPGFAWAFQRKWYNRIGFYDYGISGSGDTMSAAAWLGVEFPPGYLKRAYIESFEEYKKKITTLPKMTATSGTLFHLWHGNRTNRKYVARHECMNDVADVKSVLALNPHGAFELTDRKLSAELKRYFDERQDDGLS
jgi:hypothetical protein